LVRLERAYRRDPRTALLHLPDDARISVITLGELHLALHRAETRRQRESASGFIRVIETQLEIEVFGVEQAEAWARIHDVLRRAGQLIGERDLQIAATAVAGGHAVMTGNTGEFARVPGLVVLPPPDL